MEKSPQPFDVCVVCALHEEVRAFLEIVRQQCEGAIEARIQVTAIDPNISGIYFGLLTRESSIGVGYMAGVGGDTSLENTIFEDDTASELPRTEASYNDAVGVWYTYRVEAKNNTIKFFIDGTFMFQETVQQNPFLDAGQNGVAGLACSFLHLLVSSFQVTAL